VQLPIEYTAADSSLQTETGVACRAFVSFLLNQLLDEDRWNERLEIQRASDAFIARRPTDVLFDWNSLDNILLASEWINSPRRSSVNLLHAWHASKIMALLSAKQCACVIVFYSRLCSYLFEVSEWLLYES
jgi:hypothetical protein